MSPNRNFEVIEACNFSITVRKRPTLTHRPFEGHGRLKDWFFHLAESRGYRMAA